MGELISRIVSMPAPFNMIVMVVFIGAAAGVITTISAEIRKYFCRREELEFKRELVDRGMSADEIERVVNAGS
jgi:hypothetical protein